MRTVTGKQRGTSLIQVGSRADSKDTILEANLDWKIPSISLSTWRFYSLILIWKKVWLVEGWLKRNKLSLLLKSEKPLKKVWPWPKAQQQEGARYIPRLNHPHDGVPGVRSTHLLDGALLGAFSVSFVSLSSLFLTHMPGFLGIQYQVNHLLLNLCLRSTFGE